VFARGVDFNFAFASHSDSFGEFSARLFAWGWWRWQCSYIVMTCTAPSLCTLATQHVYNAAQSQMHFCLQVRTVNVPCWPRNTADESKDSLHCVRLP